ncbi:hypothetical protein GCM10010440_04350 [Kitasatospora cinereorecta]
MRVSGRAAGWVARVTAVVGPVGLVGAAVLATDPDYLAPGMVTGVLLLVGALLVLGVVSGRTWVVLVGAVLGVGLLAVPGSVFKAEVMMHRGVPTDVVVTAAHAVKGRGVTWHCDLRRVDGVPLRHAVLTDGCYGSGQVGRTERVLVDPAGWVAPWPADTDFGGVDVGVVLVGAAAVAFVLLAAGSVRVGARPGRTGGTETVA